MDSICNRHVAFVAGHSLGEYSALAASYALALSDAARLLKRRGLAMSARCRSAKARWRRCWASSSTSRGQSLRTPRKAKSATLPTTMAAVSWCCGNKSAVERAVAIAAERGVRRSIMLPVERALPLRADEAGGGRNGRCARQRRSTRAMGAAGRQCQRRAGARSRSDQAIAGGAGDGAGPLARMRARR